MWSLDCLGQLPAWHQKDPAQLGSCTPLYLGLCWAGTICQALFTDAEGRDALVPSSWEDRYCIKHHMLDAQGVVVRWWGKGTGVFRKREVPECRCSREQSETGAQWSRGSGGKWRRRWLWSKVFGASQAAVSSWNFALGTVEPLRDFKQGSEELRLTIQLNHFCFSVENRLQRGKHKWRSG